MVRLSLLIGSVAALLALAPLVAAAPEARPSEADLTFFESRVRPLLAKHCYACHSQKVAQGGLRLDRAGSLPRGDHGAVAVPGQPDESRLVAAVRYADPRLQMPPAGKLPGRDIETLADWVRRGAPWPSGPVGAPAAGPRPPAPRGHWAFQPLRRSSPPPAKRAAWARTSVDPFILAKLEQKGLSPSAPADRRTLIRRLSFDLVGLPPSPEAVEAFVNDPGRDAYARLVDRLLASPHYGERWARHWLDLARYCDVPESWAESGAQAWLYRDWVARALNEDLPYNEFVKRQLAADEMDGLDPKELAALGFLGLSPTYWKELKLAPDVIKTVVAEEWEERINTVSGALLGLTVACARCHDHKFDPISTRDYYALAGVFASTRLAPRPLLPAEEAREVLAARERVKALEAEVKGLEEKAKKDGAAAEELKRQASALHARLEEVKRSTPHFDAATAYAVETASLEVLPDGPDRTKLAYREAAGQDVPMQVRGNPSNPGEVVPRQFVAVLSKGKPAPLDRGSGRRELSEAIFRDAAPLAARVIVNRVWRHHFGRGLVETPSNFGLQGDRPTHPELLDELAARFIASGWSLKWLHREIILSAAYQQSSGLPNPKPESRDPTWQDADNRLLGRMSRRRLEVEAWRDSILSAAGTLDRTVGGAPQELGSPQNVRRTLYGTVRRRDLDDLLRLYDFPDPTAHSPARFHTTTPLQQLFVLNGDFIGRQAAALAARVRSERPGDTAEQVRRAYALLYGRAPSTGELEAAQRFLAESEGSPESRWNEYAEVLLARNELMFVD